MWWVPVTLFAVCMQLLRTGLQKSLKTSADDYSIVWFRFVFAVPFIPLYALLLRALGVELPSINARFFLFAALAGVSQTAGTLLMVANFSRRHFVVCTAFSRTEAVQIAVLALLFFGGDLSAAGMGAVLLGGGGVFLLLPKNLFVDGKSAVMGFGSGFCFALTSLFALGAIDALHADNRIAAAAVTLSVMIVLQTFLLLPFLYRARWSKGVLRKAVWVGVTGFLGTVGWITAFALAHPAFVKTLAQAELPLAYLLGRAAFSEKPQKREIAGIALTVLAAIAVAFVA